MPVTYTKKDDVTRQIVPTPMVSVSKELDKLGDGTIVGARYTIELTGKLLATKGLSVNPVLQTLVTIHPVPFLQTLL